MHSDVHCSYFTSLGISSPSGQEHARARIWPVLSREKNAQKELLIFAKNNALPGLPLSIRITGSSEEEWTHASALKDITWCRNPTLAKCGGEAQHLEKVRSWSPPRLLNVQNSTARPKTPCIEVFLVSLERS